MSIFFCFIFEVCAVSRHMLIWFPALFPLPVLHLFSFVFKPCSRPVFVKLLRYFGVPTFSHSYQIVFRLDQFLHLLTSDFCSRFALFERILTGL